MNIFIVLELNRVKKALPEKEKNIFDKIYKNETLLADFSKAAMTSYDGDVEKVRSLKSQTFES